MLRCHLCHRLQIQHHEISKEHDEFVILGSDGLWDYLTNEEAGFVYGAGCSPCPPTKGSKGKKSNSKHSQGKHSGSKGKKSGGYCG